MMNAYYVAILCVCVCVFVQMSKPLPWHPNIIDVQIITIGSVAVVAIPGEIT